MGKGGVVTDVFTPKITIMIPTYNQEEFIGQAVESALGQTYPNLEIIVGDDASTDETAQILNKISDHRFKYIKNPVNLGRQQNYRNILFNYATGDFVVNLDGDDYYTDPYFITEAVKLIDSNEVVIVAAKITIKTCKLEFTSEIPANKTLTGTQILEKMPDGKYFFKHMAVLYNRKKAIELDFYRTPYISSDWESLYRLATRGVVKFMDRNIGVWRIHENNETKSTDVIKLYENLSIWKLVYDDAVVYGKQPSCTKLIVAKNVAHFIQSYCVGISKGGNKELIKYLYLASNRYCLATLIVLLTPKYLLKIIACFCGYFRRKGL